MCEFEKRLIAWVDSELEAGEALKIERHLRVCAICAVQARKYREVSRAFADYCEAIATRKDSRRLRWVALGVTAAATTVAIFMLMLRPQGEPLRFERPVVAQVPAMAFRTAPVNQAAPLKLLHGRSAAKRVDARQPTWGMEPSIEIAIPVEAVFAPGAVPPGFSFAAELSIASDGSPRALRLRP